MHILALDSTLSSLGQGPRNQEESHIKAEEADCEKENRLCLHKGQGGTCVRPADAHLVCFWDPDH